MKSKRILCALLSLLMVAVMVPIAATPAAAVTVDPRAQADKNDYNTYVYYESEEERLSTMTLYFTNGAFALYCDEVLGTVAYQNLATGEVLFTNPWDMSAEPSTDSSVRIDEMAQIQLTYLDSGNNQKVINSYTDAALKGQITVKPIKNGVRVEYAIGERSSRILCPMMIEETALQEKILDPLKEALSTRDYTRFMAFYNNTYFYKYYSEKGSADRTEMIAKLCPVAAKKNINIYTIDAQTGESQKRWIESLIMEYCPNYSFEEMDNDYDYVDYVEESMSPPVFQMALEYVIDAGGLTVTLPGNGLRYDETAYRIKELKVLPYMGACNKDNEGYTFIPDGSGALYALDTPAQTSNRVYGEDYSLYREVSGLHNETIRMPVFGQVETAVDPETGVATSRGYLAIIEEGASLASLAPNHQSFVQYSAVTMTFITRQNDKSSTNWAVYAGRRYTDDYKLRYIMLTDDAKAEAAGLTSYYECSWMGMAIAYRDYLDRTADGFDRLTESDVKNSVPLYIETFGCVDTVKKIASMPVTVSVALTSFENVTEMYHYLAENGVANVNFKLTGYANGGYYSDTPYKLKWENSVGGKSGFKKLLETADAEGFGIYPDFNFVYTSQGDGGSKVNMKKNAARTIDNRYTTKRVYSATQQSLVSYYQMVLSPATYSKFYEKLGKNYAKFAVKGISLATLGNSLNSDYDENKTVLREEAIDYVTEALGYFKAKDLDIMLEGGNAFTWGYADHILSVPLDSSRYTSEYASVPFMGVVLHGYVQFAGSPLNMEGDLSYAMLKAIENGAAAYFVLSYANTELLKEDTLLSQNYSVRYDIWQSRLVEIYKELNAVLFDVQTKLIIDHQRLDGTRVPDEDELLADIAEAAAASAAAIAAKIDAERQATVTALMNARLAAEQAVRDLTLSNTAVQNKLVTLSQQRLPYAGTADAYTRMAASFSAYRAGSQAVSQLRSDLRSYVITPYVDAQKSYEAIGTYVLSAKQAYDALIAADANVQLVTTAREDLSRAIDLYVAICNNFNESKCEITEANKNAYVDDHTLAYDIAVLDGLLTVGEAVAVAAEDADAYLLGRGTLDRTTAAVVAAKAAQIAAAGTEAEDVALETLDAALDALETLLAEYQARFGTAAPALDRADYVAGAESALAALVSEEALNAYVADLYGALNEKYDGIGVQGVLNAWRTLLEAEGLTGGEAPAIDVDELIRQVSGNTAPVVVEEPEQPQEAEVVAVHSKYTVDNSIVLVTYGEGKTAYKSVLLNFNDYAVQTEVGGVTYTLDGYGYIVIYH